MADAAVLNALRESIREHYLAEEQTLVRNLCASANISDEIRTSAQAKAAAFVHKARASAERSGLIDKFLQEYGLSTKEGVTLMRLAEALLRTPDAATADALIEDKIEAGDWSSHKGKSPFPLINFSTRALMLTAAWLDDVEGNDPVRRMVSGTKDILDRLGEPVIRGAVGQAMRVMGEHFVLGESIDAAMRRSRKYATKGYNFSFDMLGEAAHTEQDARRYYSEYENAIDQIAKFCAHSDVADNPGISVKLSALYPRYEYGKKSLVLDVLGSRLRALAAKAKAANMGFNIDAEEADRLDLSLDLIEQALRDAELSNWDGFGVVVQAYQRRAPFVIDWLATVARETNRRIMVRLVKGAYWDSEIKRAQVMGLQSYPVYTRKVSTDLSFLACAKKLLSNADIFYPQFATHNALTATLVEEMAGDFKGYELQRLHGMGEALHDTLLETGVRSRIYAPVGGHKDLLPYLVRRLLENGANSSFVNQLIDPDLSVDEVVVDPFDEIGEIDTIPNPNIPAPRDYLNGERQAALGWDETHPPTASQFNPECARANFGITAQPIIIGKLTVGADPLEVKNPADRSMVVGRVNNAKAADVVSACDAAAEFTKTWSATPVSERADALRRAAENLEQQGEFFMGLAVSEAGKTWVDAIAEIREAVDFLRYYADRAEELRAPPLGVVACISPWNFPLAIFLGQVSAALAAGNCVVAKPAEQTSIIAFEAVKLLHQAGIPGGALHFLPGDGPTIGAPLVAHDSVQGVIFTGSTSTAQIINRGLAEANKPDATLIAETGGINAMIVDSTALLEQAVTDTVDSAFQSAGQRCSACRVVFVQEDVADKFKEMLSGAMAELIVGDPASLEIDVGPVIDEEAFNLISTHISQFGNIGDIIGQSATPKNDENGSFVAPTAIQIPALSQLTKEIFGPVLHLVTFDSDELDDVVDRINALGFGLTLGIHTRIDETMERIARRARIGNIYVNRNQIGAVVGVQPFGGEGLSGTGPKAGGPHYLHALTQTKIARTEATIDLSDASLSDAMVNSLVGMEKAYHAVNAANRGDILRKAGAHNPDMADICAAAADVFDELFSVNTELPGPTGEANTIKLRGRGVALCLGGGDQASMVRQIATAFAAGNCVLGFGDEAAPVIAALQSAGAPNESVIQFNSNPARELLGDPHIRLVAWDGAIGDLQKILALRSDSIIPLLHSQAPAWRYATERTLSINTTAAGGDVRLLSLPD